MVAGAEAISGFPSGTFVTPAALAAVLASYVTSTTVPGGAADGLGVQSDAEVAAGWVWTANSQMFVGSGSPSDAILPANYVPQVTDVVLYYDVSAGEPWIRQSVTTGNAQWVNMVPLILFGGT